MISPPFQDDFARADRDKRRVASASLLAALLLTAFKIVVGYWTNSLGILSEAAHSGLDMVAAAITLWAVRISSLPADREHTYGHGKFENISALFETFLLLVTCLWIIYEAVERLFFRAKVEVDPNIWAFVVVFVSIIIDISRSRALRRAADKYASQALEADALHFSTDIWSSLVVLLGLAGVWAGERYDLPWLIKADALAALGVAGIVVWVSLQLGKKTVGDLLDSVPKGMQEQVEAAVRAVPGVAEVRQVRLRRSGPVVFADVTLAVIRAAAFEQTHDIANQAEAAVRSIFPKADVVVHVEPAVPSDEDITTKVRLLAARHGLGAHGVRIYEENRQRWLELHLEVNESLLLEEAHRQASQFERDLREAVPGLERIVTHLEPAGDSAATVRSQSAGELLIHRFLVRFQNETKTRFHPHDVIVQQTGPELSVSLHCTLQPATPIVDAHDFTVRLEKYLRANIPKLGRVVIHAEPKE
ncbi:MAG: cation diffusion facilitator family transporter [Thermoguttaceae bacterium]|jgi:cation diffusion facilitator family transporter